MNFLSSALSRLTEFQALETAFQTGALPAAATGLSGIHKAAFAYGLFQKLQPQHPMLFLVGEEAEGQRLCNDLTSMGLRAFSYPARDFNFREVESVSHEYEHQRLQALCHVLENRCDCVIACIDAALQHTIPPDELQNRTRTLQAGQTVSMAELTEVLIHCGYERAEQIDGPGQFALRGGILDFFTPDAPYPIRAEFWGDEIDTLSYFDLESQRRTDPIDSVTVSPSVEALITQPDVLAEKIQAHAASLRGKTAPKAKEQLLAAAERLTSTGHLTCADKFFPFLYPSAATLFDYFSLPDTLVLVSEPAKEKERVRTTQWQWAEDCKDYLEEGVLCRGLDTFHRDWTYALDQLQKRRTLYLDSFVRGSYETPIRTLVNVTARQLSPWGGSLSLLTEDIRAMLMSGQGIVVLAGNEKTGKNLAADLAGQGVDALFSQDPADVLPNTVTITTGALSAGLEFPSAHFGVITHGRSYSQASRRKGKKKTNHTQELYSLSELTPGDYVVHATHGIGVFEGIHKIDMQGILKDYIKVRYAKKDTLYVPVTQLDLVAKYIGPREDSLVKLSRLGGAEWQKAKARVRSAVKDMAKELIKLYAQRMQAKGHAFRAGRRVAAGF